MIYRNGKELSELHHGGRIIEAVYKGARLVWEAIRSCFGQGYWHEGKPWVEGEAWKEA